MGAVRINGVDYNIFGDEAGAITYIGARFGGDTYLDCDEDRQRILLNTASQEIALFLECAGADDLDVTAATADQPTNIKNAVYELALLLSTEEGAQVLSQANTDSNLKRARAGSAEVEFFRPTSDGIRFPDSVMRQISAYANQVGLSLSGGLANTLSTDDFVSGTSNSSSFCPNQNDRNEGF